jgi:hypothetical protein
MCSLNEKGREKIPQTYKQKGTTASANSLQTEISNQQGEGDVNKPYNHGEKGSKWRKLPYLHLFWGSSVRCRVRHLGSTQLATIFSPRTRIFSF